MNKITNYLIALFLILSTFKVSAQDHAEMADGLRAEGKIYVVVAMVLIILVGFIVYLVVIDRKISQLEKRLPNKINSGK